MFDLNTSIPDPEYDEETGARGQGERCTLHNGEPRASMTGDRTIRYGP